MKRSSVLLLSVFSALLLSCSNMLDAGGSSSEVVASVKGRVFTEDGSTEKGIAVSLVPAGHNPITDDMDKVYESITDSSGYYRFDGVKSGIYNFFAQHHENSSRLLDINIEIKSRQVKINDNTLRKPASAIVGLPHGADTATGYIIIEGTPLSWPVRGIEKMSDGSFAVTIDSVPAGEIGAVKYIEPQSGKEINIVNSAVTKENETIIIGLENRVKPLWTVPLIVGITDSTVRYFGGIDSIRGKLGTYIDAINSKFDGAFSGQIDFRVDSLYSFSNSCSLEVNTPFPEKFKVRLIMDGFSDDRIDYWSKPARTAYEAEEINRFFKEYSVSAVAWQFGLALGCIPSSYLLVSSNGNPVSGKAFTGEAAFMYYPYTATSWDTYNIYAVNYYRTNVTAETPVLPGYPPSIRIVTLTSDDTPLEGTRISFFGVKWGSSAVTDTILNAVTGSDGSYMLEQNPYKTGTDKKVTWCNILIRAVTDSDTAFSWMPINEIGIAWFENPGQNYRKIIRFD